MSACICIAACTFVCVACVYAPAEWHVSVRLQQHASAHACLYPPIVSAFSSCICAFCSCGIRCVPVCEALGVMLLMIRVYTCLYTCVHLASLEGKMCIGRVVSRLLRRSKYINAFLQAIHVCRHVCRHEHRHACRHVFIHVFRRVCRL